MPCFTIQKSTLMLLLAGLVVLALATGCAPGKPGMVRDIEVLPQDVLLFIDEPEKLLINPEMQAELYHDYLARFFAPWNREEPQFSAEEVFWGIARYSTREIYAENNLPLPKNWIDDMEKQSQIDAYPSAHIPGIAVVHASMRVLPTHRPVFFSPGRPGEGFPFDYMQNTLVPAGMPLLVTHTSLDGKWALAETDCAAGWIRWHEIAIVDDDFQNAYQSKPLAGFMADGVSVLDKSGKHLVSGRVGMSLPLEHGQTRDEFLQALVPVRDRHGMASIQTGFVPEKSFQAMPFTPTQTNFARVLNSMIGQAYGWGGLYENRDCSALIKDALAGLGIFLPRNSLDQSRAGRFVSLEGLSAKQKHDQIIEQGKPWLTILYMPGHVMLYIGHDGLSGHALAYHSMWGLRTWRSLGPDGRWVIGRTVITTLEPGREMHRLARPHGLLLERITGMTFAAER